MQCLGCVLTQLMWTERKGCYTLSLPSADEGWLWSSACGNSLLEGGLAVEDG